MTAPSYILDKKGKVVWPFGLGDFTTGAAAATEYVSDATGIAQGLNPGGAQTEVGAVSQTVAQSAKLVDGLLKSAVVVNLIPGIGQTVSLVLGIVAGAAALVDAIFGSSKDKENMEKAGKYNQVNVVLNQQIQQVDLKIKAVGDGLAQLDQALKSVGLSGITSSLGSWSDDQLAAAIATNESLKKALAQKTAVLQGLIKKFNVAVQDTYNAIVGKTTTQKTVLWIIVGLAALGFTWWGIEKLNEKKS